MGTNVRSQNVYQKPLHMHSKSPLTGFKRDGFCEVPPEDKGNHSVAGTVTDAFLDFSASQGNDLRKQAGLKDGDKWCLCVNRWKEAYDARQGDDDPKVPKVRLDATNVKALDVIDFKSLKQFATEPAIQSTQLPGNHPEKGIQESQSIGGKEPRA